MKKALALFPAMLRSLLTVQAQTPVLISDITAGADGNPGSLAIYAGKRYMRATTSGTGTELYRYNGTGPVALGYDINTGSNSGVSGYEGWPMVEPGGKLYFSGITAATGTELMVYNGLGAPTLAGAEIYAGAGSSDPDYHTVLGGKLYFHADDGTTGAELWGTSGTTTTRITDLNPGSGGFETMIIWSNRLYAQADNGTTGDELYSFADPAAIAILSFDGEAERYPNPATAVTTPALTFKSAATICVVLTDAGRRTVWTSGEQKMGIGRHEISSSMSSLPTGTYFYRAIDESGKALVSGAVQKL